jgi:predicted HTH transcriptional regulator
MITHHLRKNSDGKSPDFNDLRGSSVLFGRVDTAILITPELNNQIIIDFKCRNCARPPKIIAGFDENLVLKFIKEAGARKITDEHILEVMKETPQTTIKELAERLAEKCDCKEGTAKNRIRDAIKRRIIRKEGNTKNATIFLPN